MPTNVAIAGVIAFASTPTLEYSRPIPATLREPIPPRGTDAGRGCMTVSKAQREGQRLSERQNHLNAFAYERLRQGT